MDFAFAEGLAFFVGLNGVPAGALGLVVEDEAAAFSGSREAFFGRGNRNIVTLGSVRSSFNFVSIGMLPR